MNREAFDVVTAAMRVYLLANGWVEHAADEWREPAARAQGRGRKPRVLHFGHAVNSQLYQDREWRPMPLPETPEQTHERWIAQLRGYFKDRTKENGFRQIVRSHIRWIARQTVPVTRVQFARLRRAEHARYHKNKGCSCGKEGAPY